MTTLRHVGWTRLRRTLLALVAAPLLLVAACYGGAEDVAALEAAPEVRSADTIAPRTLAAADEPDPATRPAAAAAAAPLVQPAASAQSEPTGADPVAQASADVPIPVLDRLDLCPSPGTVGDFEDSDGCSDPEPPHPTVADVEDLEPREPDEPAGGAQLATTPP